MIICAAESQMVHRRRIVGKKSLFVVVIVKWKQSHKLDLLPSEKKEMESRPV